MECASCDRDPTRDHHTVEHPGGHLAVGIVTLVYTWVGGLRRRGLGGRDSTRRLLLGAIATLSSRCTSGDRHIRRCVGAPANSRSSIPAFSFTRTYTLWGGLIGGALLSAASHGTDHLIVQRLLASRNLADCQRVPHRFGRVHHRAVRAVSVRRAPACGWPARIAPIRRDAIYPTFVMSALPSGHRWSGGRGDSRRGDEHGQRRR